MYNHLTIIGRLGEDPVLRYTQQQKAVVKLSVATSETFKNKQGQRQERTEWHQVVLFGKQAENASQYLKKGALALFEGPIRTRKWQTQDGSDRYSTELHASFMKMLPSGNGKSPDQNTAAATNPSIPAPPPVPEEQSSFADYDEFDNDIPF